MRVMRGGVRRAAGGAKGWGGMRGDGVGRGGTRCSEMQWDTGWMG